MLDGIRVLDFSTVGPAARAARWLADYGAEVVKIGPVPKPGGWQPITPPFHAYGGHRGMRQVRLDLKSEAGRDAFMALAATADVVIESFRPGAVTRMGVGYEDVKSVNPSIVYCSTSGYGQTGPRSQWAGHDINYLATGGFLHCSNRRGDGGPPLPGATVADSAAGGLHAVSAICAALFRRSTTGEGAYLDVAVADGVVSLMSLYVDEHLAAGVEPGPGHSILTGRYACYDVYETGDGRWLSVGAIEPAFWRNLCRLLDLDAYVDSQTDDAAQDEIRAALSAKFASRDLDHWVDLLASADTCVAPVLDIAEVVADEQFEARRVIVDAVHPQAGEFRQVGPVLAGQPRRPEPYEAGDLTETHTSTLLADAGLDAERISELADAGAIA